MLKNRFVSQNHILLSACLYFLMVLAGNSLPRKLDKCRTVTWIRILCIFFAQIMCQSVLNSFYKCLLSKRDNISLEDQKLKYHVPLLIRFLLNNYLFMNWE